MLERHLSKGGGRWFKSILGLHAAPFGIKRMAHTHPAAPFILSVFGVIGSTLGFQPSSVRSLLTRRSIFNSNQRLRSTMSINGNLKKTLQLGESHGTATHKLRKQILFVLLAESNRNTCFQCKQLIETVQELSIEHKEPWLDSEDPKGKFFDLNNIAFSHLSCNCRASRPVNKKYFSQEEKQIAGCEYDKRYKKKNYTKESRHAQYLRTGN